MRNLSIHTWRYIVFNKILSFAGKSTLALVIIVAMGSMTAMGPLMVYSAAWHYAQDAAYFCYVGGYPPSTFSVGFFILGSIFTVLMVYICMTQTLEIVNYEKNYEKSLIEREEDWQAFKADMAH